MSKSNSLFNDMLRDFSRQQARYAKRLQRDALLDVLLSDEDYSRDADAIHDTLERERNAHSH